MLIVDAQVHIWAASTPERPWPARQAPHKPQPVTRDDVLREMAAAGVDRAVLVPPTWEGDRNDLVLAAAQAYPERFAVTGVLNMEAPASRGLLATWLRQPGMLGVRVNFSRPAERRLLTEGHFDWLWSHSEHCGVPVMVSILPEDLHLIDVVAQRHPGLKLAIDRFALAIGCKDEQAFVGIDNLLRLARHSNVALKATCLPSYTSDSYPYRRLHPNLQRIYQAFGPARVFWGSDLTRLPGSYRQCVTMFTEEMPWLSAQDLEWTMGRGVCEWLGWKY